MVMVMMPLQDNTTLVAHRLSIRLHLQQKKIDNLVTRCRCRGPSPEPPSA